MQKGKRPAPSLKGAYAPLLSLALLLLSSFPGRAQIEHWHVLGLEEGLPQVRVYDIAQDPGGWIWVGTQGGVARYDGRNFKVWAQKDGLRTNHVGAIHPLGKNEVLLGHRYGGGFTWIHQDSVDQVEKVPDGIDSECYGLMETADSSILAATEGGLLAFHKKGAAFQVKLYGKKEGVPRKKIHGLFDPGNGTRWFRTAEQLLALKKGSSFQDPRIDTLRKKGEATPLDIESEKSGKLIALFEDELHRYKDPEAFKAENPEKRFKLPEDFDASRLTIKESGEYWVGSHGNGLLRIYQDRKVLFREKEGLPNNNIRSLLCSRANNIWIGTRDGLAYTGRLAFQFINEKNALQENNIRSIEEGEGAELWIGTENGIDHLFFKSKEMRELTGHEHIGKETLPFRSVRALFVDRKGRVWAGNLHAPRLSLLSSDGQDLLKTWQLNDQGRINSIERGPEGDLWVAGIGTGVHRFSTDNGVEIPSAPERMDRKLKGLPRDHWDLFLDSKNRLWFGSNGKGTGYYDGERFHPIDSSQGFPYPRPASITEDGKGRIWFGCIGNGAVGYKDGSIEQVKAKDGLSANNPYYVLADRQGSVWAGTSSGFDRILTEDLSVQGFGREKGLTGLEANQNACLRSDSGSLWFGTIKGLVRCAPWKIRTDSTLPQVHLQEMRLFTDPIPINEDRSFSYDQNHISFRFTGVYPDDPGKILYKYRLIGLDEHWSPATARERITFNHLPPGNYELQVKARNSDGLWTQEPLTYSFRVHPPFWETPWFIASSGGGVLLLILLIFRQRTRSLLRRQQELEQKVEERTVALRREKEESERQKELVESKNQEITDSLRYAKRIQQAILKEEKRVSEHLPPHFVFFKPKEHVSGDFYWALEKEGCLYVTVADCTGHGVPGAFMSMLGTAFLNEICAPEGLKGPARILQELRVKIVEELAQESDKEDLKDGMDISLLRLDLKTREVLWAGANNPLIRIKPDEGEKEKMVSDDGEKVLIEYKADPKPIGISDDHSPFTEYRFTAGAEETLYLYSDGFPDQFGGERGKKYKSKNFKKFLLEIAATPLEDQRKALEEEFEAWKKDQEQIDDVTVLGIRAGKGGQREKG